MPDTSVHLHCTCFITHLVAFPLCKQHLPDIQSATEAQIKAAHCQCDLRLKEVGTQYSAKEARMKVLHFLCSVCRKRYR